MALTESSDLKMKRCLDLAVSFLFRESKMTCFKVTTSLFGWLKLGELHFGLHLQNNSMAEAWGGFLLLFFGGVCCGVFFPPSQH